MRRRRRRRRGGPLGDEIVSECGRGMCVLERSLRRRLGSGLLTWSSEIPRTARARVTHLGKSESETAPWSLCAHPTDFRELTRSGAWVARTPASISHLPPTHGHRFASRSLLRTSWESFKHIRFGYDLSRVFQRTRRQVYRRALQNALRASPRAQTPVCTHSQTPHVESPVDHCELDAVSHPGISTTPTTCAKFHLLETPSQFFSETL